MLPRYVSVLLPLSVRGTFTYALPPELAERVGVGSRVVVQFGTRRYYTGIATALHEENPQPGMKLKAVTDVMDERPVLLPGQTDFWQWMADYYMCTPGEVMKAALPSGLKLESETQLVRNADFAPDSAELSDRDHALLQALRPDKGRTLMAVEKELGQPNLLRPMRRLMELGAVAVREVLGAGFKPRTEMHVKLTEDFFDEKKMGGLLDKLHRAPAQERLLLRYLDLAQASAALTLHNPAMLAEVSRKALCPAQGDEAALSALRRRSVLTTYPFVLRRLAECEGEGTEEARELLGRPPLAPEQQRAHDAILGCFREKGVCLLHGVTSSGKTEVYIRLIEEVLARGGQVLYLLPEIALTTQITARLGKVFGNRMGVYHSKFPDAERVELWQRQLSSQAFPLILGVRSSLFLPYHRLKLVIVDEEHETSYKQQEPAPRYQARDAAIMLARLCGAKVLLGTATPSMETYRHALSGKYGLVEMPHRYGGVEMPQIEVADVKELRRKKLMDSPFSPRLTEEVRAALARGEQAILFQNRRGWSPVLECHTCGWTPRCTRCDVSLTYHRTTGRLVCHYCGASYDVPQQCPCCGGTELRDMGYGTEKIEEAAHAIFPQARTARMDLDTTRSRTGYDKIISDFARGKTNLLIGTQMITKGLDFDHVSVVGILSADQMLNQADFRAYERAFQMMSQVAGRAGRRGRRGLVILQTRQPQLPVIAQIVRGDYRSMYLDQLQERTDFRFPPATRLICIYLKHRDEAVVAHAATELAVLLRPHFGLDLLGPDRPVVSRVQLLFIRKLIVKVAPTLPASGVRRTLLAARELLLARPAYKSVTLFFDVDP